MRVTVGKKLGVSRSWLVYLFPISCGVVLPVTGALNHGLALSTGSPLWTTTLVYGLAAVLTLTWMLVSAPHTPHTWREAGHRLAAFLSAHWWCWFVLTGGAIGALQHALLTVITGSLGTSLYVVGTALGQICGSVLLDSTGFAWAPVRPVNRLTLFGCAVVCAGIVVHKYEVLHPENETHLTLLAKITLVALTLLQGVATCVKASIGGQVAHLLGRYRRATTYSFLSGSVTMCLLSLKDRVDLAPLASFSHAWRLVSALCTIYIVTILFIFQRRLSGAVTYCCVIVGQLLSSTVLDLTGWLGVDRRPLQVCNVVGLSVFSVGIVIATLGRLHQAAEHTAQNSQTALPSKAEPSQSVSPPRAFLSLEVLDR